MDFDFEINPSSSPYVDMIWRTTSKRAGSLTSQATSQWEMVVTTYAGKTSITARGPETQVTPADYPSDIEFFGIIFKLGAFMPHLPPGKLINRQDLTLPEASSNAFWLHGAAWELPRFDNADVFIDKLLREELLVHEPVVDAVLYEQAPDLSLRSVQRRFRRATGLTQGAAYQIERARHARTLLQQGLPILDTVEQAGYFDQPHLTRSLKRFMGQTPAQILQRSPPG